MLKRLLTLISATFILIPAFSQSWDEIKNQTDIYLFGEGWGATVEEADQQALADLISKISIEVSSDFTITEDERTTNNSFDAQSYTNSKIQTYSTATLTNTERIVIDNNGDDAHIGRYIKKTELNRIFEGRIRSLKEYVRLGQVAQGAGKLDDALRDYYWAFSLLKSVQHPSEITYIDDDGEKRHLLTWLPEKINNIFDDLAVVITKNDGKYLDLYFTYQGEPAGNVDFTYFDGRDWSTICSAKNGSGTIEFSAGMIPPNVAIKYEYAYRGQAHINQEIKTVLGVVKGQPFPKSRVNLKTDNVVTLEEPKEKEVQSNKELSIAPVTDEKGYLEILNEVCAAIENHAYDSVMPYFTEDGQDMFNRLIKYGKARILHKNNCTLYQFGDNVIARSIQMSFSFDKGVRKNFVEDIVFTFNADSKIDCVSFGLDQKAKEDIMSKGVWPVDARLTLMEFLESYKTAYALKRIDYLRTIFDDDAVIIVGHVANKSNAAQAKDAAASYRKHRYITHTQYNKEQYLKQLESCFRSNEYINIRFANNDVRKALDGEEYGIQIKQDYYSTNYGDEGYLYLQVDLNDRKAPIIKVRTWQEEPDPEVGLFGIGNW